jgi:hypothetical protein
MHFSRDCRRRLRAPTFGSSVLVRQPGRSSCTTRTLWFSVTAPALLYLRNAEPLHPCSRPRGVTRAAGQPLAVVSTALRLLALIAMDGMYVWLFRLMAPTVGAGAKTDHKKITIFRTAP